MIQRKTIFIVTLIILISAGLIYRWIGSAASSQVDLDSEESFTIEGNTIKLNEEVRKNFYIQSEQVAYKTFREDIILNGEISIDPDRTHSIGTGVPGRILKFNKKEGDWVKKGEMILSMDSPDVAKLRSKYNSSMTRYQTAQKNSSRVKELTAMKLASDQDLRNAESEAKNWESELASDREALRILNISPKGSGTTVIFYSPISGILTNRLKAPGEIVTENTNLAIVSNLSEVWFQAKIYEQDLGRISIGDKAKVMLSAYPEDSWEGKISFLSSALSREDRTVVARITIPNREGKIKLGLLGKAFLVNENGEQSREQSAIHLPLSALIQMNSVHGVFISLNDMEYEWRPFTEDGQYRTQRDYVSVFRGLGDGEKVVVDGGYSLKSLFLKSTFGESD